MNWPTLLIIAALVVIVILLKKSGEIAPGTAREYLQHGALVIDVRSAEEFSSGHLSAAVNLPLGDLAHSLPRLAKDKNQVLLMHCQSGVRSARATSQAKAMGYAHTFNLGSFARASDIVGN